MKKLLHTLAGAFVELIESESGEFATTREKSRRLDAMMRDQRERRRPKAVTHSQSGAPPLTAGHIQSV